MPAPRTEACGKQDLAFENFRRIIRDTHVKTESFYHPDDGPAPCFHHAENAENDTAIHQRMVFFFVRDPFSDNSILFLLCVAGYPQNPGSAGKCAILIESRHVAECMSCGKCLFCVVWCESEMHSHRAAVLRTRDSRDILQITEVLQ